MTYKTQMYLRWGVIGALFAVASAAIWWQAVYTSPKQVFDDMLANNLTTSSVTKKLNSASADTTVSQRINLQLGGTNASQWFATVQTQDSIATTESIGTKTAGYVRYISLKPAKTSKPLINIWATSSNDNSELLNLFANSLLDMTSAPVPPLGMVSEPSRSKLLKFAKKEQVFKADYNKVTTSIIDGRKAYNFTVSVKLAQYIQLMQGFAHVYGLDDIDGLSASAYKSAQPVKLTISVDKLSHQMVRVTYPTTGFSETYTDYGIAHHIDLPTKTISEAELQKRLEAVR